MKVFAKCRNYSGCVKAYKGEPIELEAGAPLICSECGQAVTPVASTVRWGVLAGVLALGIAAAGIYLASHAGRPPVPLVPHVETETPKLDTPAPVTAEPAEPPAEVVAPEKIDLGLTSAETQKIKTEVLERIDAMPTLSKASKEKLYASVERARSMGKVLTIPFRAGKATLAPEDIELLRNALETPQMRKLRDDATAVFVLLGYADPKGDKAKNLAVSQTRADSVVAAMRDKCAVINVMHPVAMGSSHILDSKNLEKNRIVEIWVVLP